MQRELLFEDATVQARLDSRPSSAGQSVAIVLMRTTILWCGRMTKVFCLGRAIPIVPDLAAGYPGGATKSWKGGSASRHCSERALLPLVLMRSYSDQSLMTLFPIGHDLRGNRAVPCCSAFYTALAGGPRIACLQTWSVEWSQAALPQRWLVVACWSSKAKRAPSGSCSVSKR